MRILGLSIALAGALLATDYSYEVSPMIGGVMPEGNLNIDDSDHFNYGLRLQMNDYDFLGLVPELSYDRSLDTDYETQAGDTAINRFGLNGLYDFEDVSDTLTPYVLIGIGYEHVESEPAVAYDSSVYGNYGAGVKWTVFEDIALRAEVKHLIRTDDGGDELYYGIGLNIPFGEKGAEPVAKAPAPVELDGDNDGVLDNSDKCPTTPAGRTVDAKGCELDGDNDGVVDGLDKCLTTAAGRSVDAKGCELDSDKDGVVDALDKCPTTVSGVSVDANGCAQSIILAIKFENASSVINEKDSPKLQEYVEFMKKNTAYDTTIIGHTDSRGSAAFNQNLSQERADAVKAKLVEKGISASRVDTVGKGEESPIATNETSKGRAENRRIEAQLRLQK